jgi:hypothetical protein
VVKAVEARSYDLTVFKVKWGNLTLKIYDKGERVLRIEVVADDVIAELSAGMATIQPEVDTTVRLRWRGEHVHHFPLA